MHWNPDALWNDAVTTVQPCIRSIVRSITLTKGSLIFVDICTVLCCSLQYGTVQSSRRCKFYQTVVLDVRKFAAWFCRRSLVMRMNRFQNKLQQLKLTFCSMILDLLVADAMFVGYPCCTVRSVEQG
jgi:hypothetical protein